MGQDKKAIKLLKDHHSGKKKGFQGEVDNARAEYLVRTNQAEYVPDEKVVAALSKQNKARASKKNTQPPCPTC